MLKSIFLHVNPSGLQWISGWENGIISERPFYILKALNHRNDIMPLYTDVVKIKDLDMLLPVALFWIEYFDTMQLINDFCQSWYVTVTNWWCSVVFMFCYNWEKAKMIWQINGVKSILLDCMNYFPSPKFYSLVNTFRSKNTKCTRCKSYLYFSQWLSNLLCN